MVDKKVVAQSRVSQWTPLLSIKIICLALYAKSKNMKLKLIRFLLAAFVVVLGCSGPKVLVSEKTNAEKAIATGDFAAATEAWKLYFAQTPVENVDGGDFASAAQSAFKSGNSELATSWFDQARYKKYADPKMYTTLAAIYRSQNNISKELSALEYIKANFNDAAEAVNERLFAIYNEIGMNEKALRRWNELDDSAKNETINLERYFQIKKSLADTAAVDSVSLVLLQKDPSNVDALEWNAMKLYWKGERRYQTAMENYNRRKTTRQYKILLKELDLATAEMKKSLVYFERLWAIDPGKKYASYLSNIHARFGEEEKAEEYEKFLE